jgi:hypothetical protein
LVPVGDTEGLTDVVGGTVVTVTVGIAVGL